MYNIATMRKMCAFVVPPLLTIGLGKNDRRFFVPSAQFLHNIINIMVYIIYILLRWWPTPNERTLSRYAKCYRDAQTSV